MPKKRASKSKTAAQLPGYNRILTRGLGNVPLLSTLPATYQTYRVMRKNPTIAMARNLAIAPIVSCKWSIEGPDASDELVETSQKLIDELQDIYLSHIVKTCYDYGWGAFEQFYDEDYNLHLKPLINDNTQVLITDTGDYAGVFQNPDVRLNPEECVFVAMNVEAGSLYGSSTLENARTTYANWLSTNLGADRYDQKIAGSHWIVYYPSGIYKNDAGEEVDNSDLANNILADLESSGAVALPLPIAEYVEDLNKSAQLPQWKVELLSDSNARQGSFIERLRYLDTLFVRSFNLPERTILEGEFGTKAESEVHQNFALIHMDVLSRHFAKEFEKQVLLPYLGVVAGETDVHIVPAAINPDALLYQRQIAKGVISAQMVDADSLLDLVGIPKSENIIEVQQMQVQDNQDNQDNQDTQDTEESENVKVG